MFKLMNRFILRWPRLLFVLVVLIMLCFLSGAAFAGGMSTGDAYTVRGKAPGAVNGLATLNSSGIVDQAVASAGSLTMQGETYRLGVGIITVLSTATTISSNTLDIGTVTAGDRIYVSTRIWGTKGATAGKVSLSVVKTGTAQAYFYDGPSAALGNASYFGASDSYGLSCSGVMHVTNGGTLQINATAFSVGSNFTVASGDWGLYYFFLKKQ